MGSKIFPHILLLCSISYSCFNGLTINQDFIKPLQGEKCTSCLSVVDLSIVLPRVFFFAALCGRTNLRLRSRARTPTKLLRSTFKWLFTIKRGRIGLCWSLHGQLVLDIRPRCWLRMLKLTSRKTRQLLPSSVNISAEYPALPDHDSMNNPSGFIYWPAGICCGIFWGSRAAAEQPRPICYSHAMTSTGMQRVWPWFKHILFIEM